MVERATDEANRVIKAHAHMLRHACGYKLANDYTARSRPIRSPQHSEHDALYRLGAVAVQGNFRD
jgi:hypothetical protein